MAFDEGVPFYPRLPSFGRGPIRLRGLRFDLAECEWDLRGVRIRVTVPDRDTDVPLDLNFAANWPSPPRSVEHMAEMLEGIVAWMVAHEIAERMMVNGVRNDPHYRAAAGPPPLELRTRMSFEPGGLRPMSRINAPMIPVIVRWFGSDGGDQSLPISLPVLPPIGSLLDLSMLPDNALEYIAESERDHLEALRVVDVKISAVASPRLGIVADLTVERDPEVEHQRELEAKDSALAYVQCTIGQCLDLLQIVVGDGVFFALDGGGDKRDLIALHVSEHVNIGSELMAAVDAVFVYPTYDDAKARSGKRRCVKHRHAELVSK